MIQLTKPLGLIAVSAFTLSACVAPNLTPTPAAPNAAITPTAQTLVAQETALRAGLGGGDIVIVNTGSQLDLTFPEAIIFDGAGADLSIGIKGRLAILASNINNFPNTTVGIFGHTDSNGPASFNLQLSADRADAIYNLFVRAGVSIGRLTATGRGETDPVATNLTAEGRLKNRRIEIIIRPRGNLMGI
ncbi:MAG: OmpA family protein [Alphaproteobacteria bacterium]|nr:OmpA family protein [Alphaproteobacteria bacterium]